MKNLRIKIDTALKDLQERVLKEYKEQKTTRL